MKFLGACVCALLCTAANAAVMPHHMVPSKGVQTSVKAALDTDFAASKTFVSAAIKAMAAELKLDAGRVMIEDVKASSATRRRMQNGKEVEILYTVQCGPDNSCDDLMSTMNGLDAENMDNIVEALNSHAADQGFGDVVHSSSEEIAANIPSPTYVDIIIPSCPDGMESQLASVTQVQLIMSGSMACADIDGCKESPCGHICYDVPAPGDGYSCSACPDESGEPTDGTGKTPDAECNDPNSGEAVECITGDESTGAAFCYDVNDCAREPTGPPTGPCGWNGEVCTDVSQTEATLDYLCDCKSGFEFLTPPATCHMISPGGNSATVSVCAPDEEEHETRCCADHDVGDSWDQKTCGDQTIWVESEFDESVFGSEGGCEHSLDYFQASAYCAAHGGRLCTQQEVEDQCTAGTGCNHDDDLVWTSTEDPDYEASMTCVQDHPCENTESEDYCMMAVGTDELAAQVLYMCQSYEAASGGDTVYAITETAVTACMTLELSYDTCVNAGDFAATYFESCEQEAEQLSDFCPVLGEYMGDGWLCTPANVAKCTGIEGDDGLYTHHACSCPSDTAYVMTDDHCGDADGCSPNPCLSGAGVECLDTLASEEMDGADPYDCVHPDTGTYCPPGWATIDGGFPDTCEDQRPCTCEGCDPCGLADGRAKQCINSDDDPESYECICQDDGAWEYIMNDGTCEAVEPCNSFDESDCTEEATCTDLGHGMHACVCPGSDGALGLNRAYWGDGKRQESDSYETLECDSTVEGVFPGGSHSWVFQGLYNGEVTFNACGSHSDCYDLISASGDSTYDTCESDLTLGYQVRCCSDQEMDGFVESSCGDVWVPADESDSGSLAQCQAGMNYEEASGYCQQHGARMCSRHEVSAGCTNSLGCGDGDSDDMVWTTTNELGPKGCHHVAPGRGPAANNNEEERCADEAELHEVRCCSDIKLTTADTGAQWKKKNCDVDDDDGDADGKIWASSKLDMSAPNNGCEHGMTWQEAKDKCESIDGRLCTRAELNDKCTKGTGCGHDADLIWAADGEGEPVTVEVFDLENNYIAGGTCSATIDAAVARYIVSTVVLLEEDNVHLKATCSDVREEDPNGEEPMGCVDYPACGAMPCFSDAELDVFLDCYDTAAEDVLNGDPGYTCAQCPAGYQEAGSGLAWECGPDENGEYSPGTEGMCEGRAGCQDLNDCGSLPCGVRTYVDGTDIACHDIERGSEKWEGDNVHRCAADEEEHEVRCCSDIKLTEAATGAKWSKKNCAVDDDDGDANGKIWASSKLDTSAPDNGCEHGLTYQQAYDKCDSLGARLCTREELYNDCAKGTGCQHDGDLIWASTQDLMPAGECTDTGLLDWDCDCDVDGGYIADGDTCVLRTECNDDEIAACHELATCNHHESFGAAYHEGHDCLCPDGYTGDGYGSDGCQEINYCTNEAWRTGQWTRRCGRGLDPEAYPLGDTECKPVYLDDTYAGDTGDEWGREGEDEIVGTDDDVYWRCPDGCPYGSTDVDETGFPWMYGRNCTDINDCGSDEQHATTKLTVNQCRGSLNWNTYGQFIDCVDEGPGQPTCVCMDGMNSLHTTRCHDVVQAGTNADEKNRCAADDEVHEVRCCAYYKPSNQWTKKVCAATGETIWAESNVDDGSCMHAATFAEANKVCGEIGGRLCSYKEINNDCTKGSGCGHDGDNVWAYTVEKKDCADLVPASDLAEEHPRCADKTEAHEVRCCAESQKFDDNGDEWPKQDNCEATGGSLWVTDMPDTPGTCRASNKYSGAQWYCESEGARLCTRSEILEGCTAVADAQGCQHEHDLLWASTDEMKSCHDVIGATDNNKEVQYCAADDEKHEMRCCSSSQISGWKKNTCDGVDLWSESDANGIDGCQHGVTWDEAWEICRSIGQGSRLCTREEVEGKCANGSGFQHDGDMIWTSSAELVPGEMCQSSCSQGYTLWNDAGTRTGTTRSDYETEPASCGGGDFQVVFTKDLAKGSRIDAQVISPTDGNYLPKSLQVRKGGYGANCHNSNWASCKQPDNGDILTLMASYQVPANNGKTVYFVVNAQDMIDVKLQWVVHAADSACALETDLTEADSPITVTLDSPVDSNSEHPSCGSGAGQAVLKISAGAGATVTFKAVDTSTGVFLSLRDGVFCPGDTEDMCQEAYDDVPVHWTNEDDSEAWVYLIIEGGLDARVDVQFVVNEGSNSCDHPVDLDSIENNHYNCHDYVRGANYGNNNNEEVCQENDVTGNVKCCATHDIEGWKKAANDGWCGPEGDRYQLWLATKHMSPTNTCPEKMTFQDAAETCSAAGGRLCTRYELAEDCGKWAGCQLDGKLVWASTQELATDDNRDAMYANHMSLPLNMLTACSDWSGQNGPEAVFQITVPDSNRLMFVVSEFNSNTADTEADNHRFRLGMRHSGSCPGNTELACTTSDDLNDGTTAYWQNDETGADQVVWITLVPLKSDNADSGSTEEYLTASYEINWKLEVVVSCDQVEELNGEAGEVQAADLYFTDDSVIEEFNTTCAHNTEEGAKNYMYQITIPAETSVNFALTSTTGSDLVFEGRTGLSDCPGDTTVFCGTTDGTDPATMSWYNRDANDVEMWIVVEQPEHGYTPEATPFTLHWETRHSAPACETVHPYDCSLNSLTISSTDGTTLVDSNGYLMLTDAPEPWQVWDFEDAGSGKYYIISNLGQKLEIDSESKWTLAGATGDRYYLRGESGSLTQDLNVGDDAEWYISDSSDRLPCMNSDNPMGDGFYKFFRFQVKEIGFNWYGWYLYQDDALEIQDIELIGENDEIINHNSACLDSDDGAYDVYGDDCDWYDAQGGADCVDAYDDADFSTLEMCCICGGGTAGQNAHDTNTEAECTNPDGAWDSWAGNDDSCYWNNDWWCDDYNGWCTYGTDCSDCGNCDAAGGDNGPDNACDGDDGTMWEDHNYASSMGLVMKMQQKHQVIKYRFRLDDSYGESPRQFRLQGSNEYDESYTGEDVWDDLHTEYWNVDFTYYDWYYVGEWSNELTDASNDWFHVSSIIEESCEDSSCAQHGVWSALAGSLGNDNFYKTACCTAEGSSCGPDFVYKFDIPAGARITVKVMPDTTWDAYTELRYGGECSSEDNTVPGQTAAAQCTSTASEEITYYFGDDAEDWDLTCHDVAHAGVHDDDQRCALDTEVHTVRCCSDTEMDGWVSGDCHGASEVWTDAVHCFSQQTYQQAKSTCEAEGARLCTLAEITHEDCMVHVDCNGDFADMVWASTTDLMTTTCHDVGCPEGDCSTDEHCAHDYERHQVRCCLDEEFDGSTSAQCTTDEYGATATIWSNSYISPEGCADDYTWGEANNYCQSNGARLCSIYELNGGCTSDTVANGDAPVSCGNSDLVWATTGELPSDAPDDYQTVYLTVEGATVHDVGEFDVEYMVEYPNADAAANEDAGSCGVAYLREMDQQSTASEQLVEVGGVSYSYEPPYYQRAFPGEDNYQFTLESGVAGTPYFAVGHDTTYDHQYVTESHDSFQYYKLDNIATRSADNVQLAEVMFYAVTGSWQTTEYCYDYCSSACGCWYAPYPYWYPWYGWTIYDESYCGCCGYSSYCYTYEEYVETNGPVTPISASQDGGQNGDDVPDNAIDGDYSTVWRDYSTNAIVFEFDGQVTVDRYQFVTSDDDWGVDPVQWALYGANSLDVDDDGWALLSDKTWTQTLGDYYWGSSNYYQQEWDLRSSETYSWDLDSTSGSTTQTITTTQCNNNCCDGDIDNRGDALSRYEGHAVTHKVVVLSGQRLRARVVRHLPEYNFLAVISSSALDTHSCPGFFQKCYVNGRTSWSDDGDTTDTNDFMEWTAPDDADQEVYLTIQMEFEETQTHGYYIEYEVCSYSSMMYGVGTSAETDAGELWYDCARTYDGYESHDFSVGPTGYDGSYNWVPDVEPATCDDWDLHLYDSWGDGWNGATIEVYDCGDNLLVSTGMDWGWVHEADICLDGSNGAYGAWNHDGHYQIEAGGGWYDYEISWDLLDADGNVAQSGGAGTYDFCPCNGNDWDLHLYDSWGDGWNGATITVYDCSTWETLVSTTMSAGWSHVADICLEPSSTGDGAYYIYAGGGWYDYEISWDLKDDTGYVVHSGGSGTYDAC
jgi:hypothetical protein